MTAININKNNFQSEVMNSDKPVLLDFWAPWCAPCRMVVPIIEEIAGERPDIRVGSESKIDAMQTNIEIISCVPKTKVTIFAREAPIALLINSSCVRCSKEYAFYKAII